VSVNATSQDVDLFVNYMDGSLPVDGFANFESKNTGPDAIVIYDDSKFFAENNYLSKVGIVVVGVKAVTDNPTYSLVFYDKSPL